MTVEIVLYTRDTIDRLPWPDTEDGAYARRFLLPLMQQGPEHFIVNVQTHYMVLLIDAAIVLPISVNKHEYSNSYVCSPYTHYVTYAKEELVLIRQHWVRNMLRGLINGFGVCCKLGNINRVVHVNNWLLSTNLYPALSREQVEAIIQFLRIRFPDHAILFRSLNEPCNSSLLHYFTGLGCKLVPSRQVYLVNPAEPRTLGSKARWLLKRDYALIAKQGYAVCSADELDIEDVARIVQLYNELYLEKYSVCNPMFNQEFIELALKSNTLQLIALKRDGRIDAVLGYFQRNGVMTTPVFGYDTALPQDVGLYRMLSVLLFRIAEQTGYLLHESSGAAQFKRNRGADSAVEYSAVYMQHLPFVRRWPWYLLRLLLTHIGVPLMQKYKL